LDSECPIYGCTVNECPLGDEPDWSAWDDDDYLLVHEDEAEGRIEHRAGRACWGED
jgi:hypothetical protein